MKRMLLLAILVMAGVVSYAQNEIPDEFFGMKFGIVYSLDEMKGHVGSAGTFVQEEDSLEVGAINYKGYIFREVNYNDRCYPSMALMVLEHGMFGGVMFTFTTDDISEDRSLETIYGGLKRSLEEEYGEFEERPVNDYPELCRLACFHDGMCLRLDKWLTNNEIRTISISYISMFATLADAYSAAFPTIQDTFFGMKMGSRQTTYSVRSAVGRRGEYLEEKLTSYGKKVIFKKMIFAGETWDYGEFGLTEDGELFDVYVYDSLKDGYGYDDEKKEAERTYTSYKNKLDEKYGSQKENDDDGGKYVCYVGHNDMAIILSNKRGKSSGGEYRRFVGIDYIQTEINKKVSSLNDDEL